MIQSLQKILSKQVRYLVLTHVEPDFDAIGSVLALCHTLELSGYQAVGVVETIPYFMHFLPGIQRLTTEKPPEWQDFEVIALDAASRERVFKKEWLDIAKQVINIDHHQDNPLFGDINWVNTQVSSTSEFLYRLFTKAGLLTDRETILPLYAGILYDTGGFRYSNTKPDTLLVASQMMVPYPDDIAALSEQVFSRWNADSFQALMNTLQRVEYWMNGQVCFSAIPAEINACLPSLSFEGIVDILRLHYAVRMVLMIREISPGVIKGSLRSKPPLTVSQFANAFGGGGHLRAAGFITDRYDLETLKTTLFQMVESYFHEQRVV